MNRRLFSLFAVAAVLAACGAEKPAFKSIDITGAEYARRLELPDTSGKPRTLADFKGKVVIVFFGYTQCPDVCPATMAEIAEMRQKLGAEGAQVQPVFVTVDPERDTDQVASAYATTFGGDVVALRGSVEQTRAAAKEFKVFFAKAPGRTADSYTIDHTAGAFVFDRQGKVRLFARYGSGADALAHDVKLLLGGA
ncbi:MAG: SCO family protein [Aquincola sp.]|nr:SCO family protein [Aquincola sp.]MDH4289352.1 SCO family protein [Aquincola sp.]MDH5330761.1 SCO family protein [Aquincola sp.]